MTLPTLLAHVAARWAVTRTPAHGWVPDESETDMTEHEPRTYTQEDMARARQEGRAEGWDEGAETAWQATGEGWNGEYAGEYSTHDGAVSFREANDDIPNPYEQEEA